MCTKALMIYNFPYYRIHAFTFSISVDHGIFVLLASADLRYLVWHGSYENQTDTTRCSKPSSNIRILPSTGSKRFHSLLLIINCEFHDSFFIFYCAAVLSSKKWFSASTISSRLVISVIRFCCAIIASCCLPMAFCCA